MLNDITGSFEDGRPAAAICLKNETLLSPLSVLKITSGLAAWILFTIALKSVPPSGTYSSPATIEAFMDDMLLEDQVGGAGKHIVGAEQEVALVTFLLGPIERRQESADWAARRST